MEKEIKKKVKKLVKTNPLRLLGIKHATEYITLSEKIEKLQYIIVPDSDANFYEKIEEQCVDGLYKQHIAISMEPKLQNFYNEFNYENLMEKYEEKIDELRKNTEDIISAQSKKEMLYNERLKIIDMLSRQFASNDYTKINLIEIANFGERNVRKLYISTKEVLEEVTEKFINEKLENLKENLTNYWNEKQEKEAKTKIEVKTKFSLWEWIKQFFRFKKKLKMIEAPKEIEQ